MGREAEVGGLSGSLQFCRNFTSVSKIGRPAKRKKKEKKGASLGPDPNAAGFPRTNTTATTKPANFSACKNGKWDKQ